MIARRGVFAWAWNSSDNPGDRKKIFFSLLDRGLGREKGRREKETEQKPASLLHHF